MKRASQAEVTLGQMISSFEEQHDQLHQALKKIRTEMETLETVIAELQQKRMTMAQARQRVSDQQRRKHVESK